jgi:hypothetical protein
MVACLGRSVEIAKFMVVGMTQEREVLRGLEQYGMCPAQMKRVDAWWPKLAAMFVDLSLFLSWLSHTTIYGREQPHPRLASAQYQAAK